MNRRAALAALTVLGALTAGLGVPAVAAPAAAVAAPECKVDPGGPDATDFWPQQRLNFTRAWSVTRGQGVTIAVVDSGLNTQFDRQLSTARVRPGVNVIGGAFAPTDTRDCYYHGTAVTSLIVAQPSSSTDFVGIAPDAAVVPIKQTNTDQDDTGTSEGIGRGILAALDRDVAIVNVSITTPVLTPELERAVALAQRRGVLIVAAAGNDGERQQVLRPAYPAALSPRFDNVVAVSATDRSDAVAAFSNSGSYVSVAAPGTKVIALAPRGGFRLTEGTSFATPFVAGTAALVIASHPGITPAQVRQRLEATADAPPADVPSATYGYGVINPYLAVTSPISDLPRPMPSARVERVAAAPVPEPADRGLQDLALGIAYALLGLSVAAVSGALVLRRRAHLRNPAGTSSPGVPGDRDLIRR